MSSPYIALPLDSAGVPELLKKKKAWVNWRADEREGRLTKVPYTPTGGRASTTNPATWSSFDAVMSANSYSGIGIVLIDDLVGIDLDKCLDEQGVLEPWAQQVVAKFPGSYIERSPSGRGLHILCLGAPKNNGKGGPENRLELYSKASPRYFTVTGSVYQFGTIVQCQDALDAVVDDFIPVRVRNEPARSLQDAASLQVELDDCAIIEMGCRLNKGFAKLWSGEDVYGDNSSNDMALCNHLCFWLERDPVRIDAAFRLSGLMRAKWDEPRGQQTYGELTIDKARQRVVNTYRPGGAAEPRVRAESGSSGGRQGRPLIVPLDFSKPVSAPETLIQRFLPRDGVGMLWGDPGSFKSFLAIDWALRIVTGTQWNSCKVSKGSVWYLAGEGLSGIRTRVDAWLKHNQRPSTEVGDRFLMTSSAVVFNEFDGGRSEEVEQLAELIQSGKGPQMIVVDTVARSMSGDENTAKDTGGFIRAVDYLIDLARSQGHPLCVLLVHHAKKTGEEYRGSSAFRGAMDFEYRMVKKGNAHCELSCTKMKDLEMPEAVYFDRGVVDLGCQLDNHGDMLDIRSLVLDVSSVEPKDADVSDPKERERQAAYMLVQEEIQTAWEAGSPFTSKKEIETSLKDTIPREQIRKALDGRMKSGWVHRLTIDSTIYQLVDRRTRDYFVGLTVEEHGMHLKDGRLPGRVLVPPTALAKPWSPVSEAVAQQAEADLRKKRERLAANEQARVKLEAEAAAQFAHGSSLC
jgi:putative DNA primase/helicase